MEEVLVELFKNIPTFAVLIAWISSERSRNDRLETELRSATQEHIRTLETIKDIAHNDHRTPQNA